MSAAAASGLLGAQPGELERLRSFYESMKREGVAFTREYDLPALDTIGRRFVLASGERGAAFDRGARCGALGCRAVRADDGRRAPTRASSISGKVGPSHIG